VIKEFKDEYRWLSNFWPVTITYEGLTYPSVEHAYQAQKTNDLETRKKFADPMLTAGQAKRLGSKIELRGDWTTTVRILVMKDLTNLKYQDLILRKKLLATGKEPIQEGNGWHDTFWGVDLKTGEGLNTLGQIIMVERQKTRDALHHNTLQDTDVYAACDPLRKHIDQIAVDKATQIAQKAGLM